METADKYFKGKYKTITVRFRNQFCYIDKYDEPYLPDNWLPLDGHETREEYLNRLRNSPTHLCRLRFLESAKWSFAFYRYSSETYEPSLFPSGELTGIPEDALLACFVYFHG